MTITKDYIKNTILIGLSFVFLKSFNLALPYFLDGESYNAFNKVFYYASLLSTMGTFGFTYAITQINLPTFFVSLLVLINTLVSFLLVFIFSGVDVSILNIFNVFIISSSSILFSIYNFKLLFNSKIKNYFITIIIFSVSHYIALSGHLFFGLNLLLFYGLLSFIAIIFCFGFFEIGLGNKIRSVGKFYKIAASTFIINSAAGIILMADKFFANNIFDSEIANAYTFSWAIIAPIFYLGNIAEKNIYASKEKKSLQSSIKNSIGLILLGLVGYSIIIVIITNYVSFLLPQSINLDIFNKIIFTMLAGYSVYIIFHFPINGMLFKFNLHKVQKATALSHIFILGVFVVLFYINIISIEANDYFGLFLVIISILMLLSVSKVVLVIFLQRREIIEFFSKA